MTFLCDRADCYGCAACYTACKAKAIQMEPDDEGFSYPVIDAARCTQCGLCARVCAAVHTQLNTAPEARKVYACQAADVKIRKGSTSGGLYVLLACSVLARGGSVYGAACNAAMDVEHIRVTNVSQLEKTRGSKYVQSRLGSILAQVKDDLATGKPVLFSGTPCQVSGLLAYLGKRYDNLLTCDVVCHGVPSPRVWRSYKSWQEARQDGKCTAVNFRSKRLGWHCYSMEMTFANGKTYRKAMLTDPFCRGFLRNLFLRPSCHNCAFASSRRVSDITLGDYWGYNERAGIVRHDETGISMALLNTEKGSEAFQNVRELMRCEERTLQDAASNNPCLRRPSPAASHREAFWNDYHSLAFQTVIDRYMMPDPDAKKKRIKWSWAGRCFFILKKRLRRILVRDHGKKPDSAA